MPSQEITFRSVADWERHRERLRENYIPAVKRGMLSGALRCVQILQDATRVAPPANPAGIGSGGAVDTQAFISAWSSEALPNGARVFNFSPHAGVVEYGRRAGSRRPRTEWIVEWAQRRLGLSRREAQRAAYVIAKAIGQRGLVGRRIMASRYDMLRRTVRREVLAELRAAQGTTA